MCRTNPHIAVRATLALALLSAAFAVARAVAPDPGPPAAPEVPPGSFTIQFQGTLIPVKPVTPPAPAPAPVPAPAPADTDAELAAAWQLYLNQDTAGLTSFLDGDDAFRAATYRVRDYHKTCFDKFANVFARKAAPLFNADGTRRPRTDPAAAALRERLKRSLLTGRLAP